MISIARLPLVAALEPAEDMPMTISVLLPRTITTDTVIAVEYAITPLGRTLGPLFQALDGWTQDHVAEVESARRRYDGLAD